MSADTPDLTIIVPAFNAAPLLPQCAQQFKDAAADGILAADLTQVIFVDDGSTDGTGRCAEDLLARDFPRLRVIRFDKNAGKGAAVRAGIAAAEAPLVLFTDVDMSVEPTDIPALVDALGSVDVAIGSRSVPESVVESFNVQRRIMGRTFNRFVQAVTGLPFLDTQCGIKAFRTPTARLLFHLTNARRFAFDVEILVLARQLGLEIAEVAVYWHEKQESSVRLLVDPLSMVRDVTNLRFQRDRRHVPALAVPCRGDGVDRATTILRDACHASGVRYPIFHVSDDEVVALLPLCDGDIAKAVVSSLRRVAPEWEVEERAISFSGLKELLPLAGPAAHVSAAGSAPSSAFKTFAGPTDSWEPGHGNGNGSAARVHPA
jgi:glycosyltransferase involved in cell wall biosynthesis